MSHPIPGLPGTPSLSRFIHKPVLTEEPLHQNSSHGNKWDVNEKATLVV